MGLKTEPREASFPWLRHCYGSWLQLHVQLQTWSTSNFHPLAGLRLELALEPAVEPCQRGPTWYLTAHCFALRHLTLDRPYVLEMCEAFDQGVLDS